MGGENESLLEADKGGKKNGGKGTVLEADPEGKGATLQADVPPAQASPVTPGPKTEKKKPEPPRPVDLAEADVPRQYQTIRQHVSAGHCHFHDDENKLKVSIPVAEWWVILRQLKSMQPYTYVDTDFRTVAYFRPYLFNGYFDVAVEMVGIDVGVRFKALSDLAKTRG